MEVKLTEEIELEIINFKVEQLRKRMTGNIKASEFIRYFLEKGWPNHMILNGLEKEFPKSNANLATISGYRMAARRKGLKVPKSVDANLARKLSE